MNETQLLARYEVAVANKQWREATRLERLLNAKQS